MQRKIADKSHHSNLSEALDQSVNLQKRQEQFPPVNSGHHRSTGGVQDILDEEMQWIE